MNLVGTFSGYARKVTEALVVLSVSVIVILTKRFQVLDSRAQSGVTSDLSMVALSTDRAVIDPGG